MTRGGKGFKGEHRNKTKKAISRAMNNEANRKRIFTKERSLKISKALAGRKKSKEHRVKLSEQAKKRTGSKNPFFGKKHSIETKQKISELNSKSVLMLDLNGNIINEFKNGRECANYVKSLLNLDYKVESIYRRINWRCSDNSLKPYVGYIWKYKV